MTGASTAVVWFRRDLRIADHPALHEAATCFDEVACLYVLDDRLLQGRYRSPRRAAFLRESLLALAASIEGRGGTLAIRRGRPEDVVPAFAREVQAGTVFVSRDYTPYATKRDGRVAAALGLAGVDLRAMPGLLVAEPEEITNQEGRGFQVFTAFFRRWTNAERRAVLPAPRLTAPAGLQRLAASDLNCLKLYGGTTSWVEGGEGAARRRLERWVEGPLTGYALDRDRLDLQGTSGLSQDLHFGLLSPVTVLAKTAGAGRFAQEIAWRDFYLHMAWHSPTVLRKPLRKTFADFTWVDDREALSAWKNGQTGYPVVDAGMRQLAVTGWMHNRARMIVASFLTKHLLIDYREGERFFMEQLVDGDVAVNNGGWQWASSTGADAQPYFRVFNPVLQGRRFDPEGTYVRRWLPELQDLPPRYVHQPWEASPEVQRAAHCIVGIDYPGPIVPPGMATARAKAFYSSQLRVQRDGEAHESQASLSFA